MANQFHQLSIEKINQEIPGAHSITFEVPGSLSELFNYKAGQYLTVKVMINGQEERRSYSMSSSPRDGEVTITVKQVEGGKVSNFLCKEIKVGDSLEVMAPEGRFTPKLNPEISKSYYLFAGGSGITPLMSILKTIMEEEPLSFVHLLYGNRNEDTIIFQEALSKLKLRYGDQFVYEHILSQPKKEKAGGITGMFKKAKMNWSGKVGRINTTTIQEFLNDNPTKGTGAEYFLCGPAGMMETVNGALLGKGISEKLIHQEYFVVAKKDQSDTGNNAPVSGNVSLEITLDGTPYQLELKDGETVLEAALREKMDAPFSCQSGACSTCMAKVVEGKVAMDSCLALDDDEVENGYVLTCQSRPTTNTVKITYDV